MYFVIRNPVSLINTVFNGFIPKNFADLNLLQLCYDAIKIGDSNGFIKIGDSNGFSKILRRPLSTKFLFNTDLT